MIQLLEKFYVQLATSRRNENGFTTAELLGNAALGILALAGIWAAMTALGVDVMNQIKSLMQLNGNPGR